MIRLYLLGAAVLLIAGLSAWAVIERRAAAANLERATAAEWAASDARAAAVANAASADWLRRTAEAGQALAAGEERKAGETAARIHYIVQEVYRAPDAYSPLRAALRAALVRLRELNATGPGAPRAGDAAQADGASGAAGQAGPARPVTPATDAAFGAYCVALLGHVIRLEEKLVAVGAYWDMAAAGLMTPGRTDLSVAGAPSIAR